eukprot:TRINITY_DN10957_c0_g1_i1.p1 TRINITY_DN10957_c0_g1~~TRINITY_DN10957_c0_g1_i1.p1  ORF type:complete len:448 (-),score=-14.02 TRINITY_DN10957_c0_g1_i1:180-1523(-)
MLGLPAFCRGFVFSSQSVAIRRPLSLDVVSAAAAQPITQRVFATASCRRDRFMAVCLRAASTATIIAPEIPRRTISSCTQPGYTCDSNKSLLLRVAGFPSQWSHGGLRAQREAVHVSTSTWRAGSGSSSGVLGARAMASGAVAAVESVVSPAWVHDNLGKVKVLDASWYMPAEKRKTFDEFQAAHIPGALFFDIDAIADPNTDLPHMLPTAAAFSAAASALGLSSRDHIVVYDTKGLFSAARAWWMFRVFGHAKVSVLDGGLPAYRAAGFPIDGQPSDAAASRVKAAATALKDAYTRPGASNRLITFQAKLQPQLLLSLQEVRSNIEGKTYQLIDARSAGRFKGVDPEPRAGVRGGSVPGSFNVPFPQVLTASGELKPADELIKAFADAGVSVSDTNQALAVSCGTGVTACVLALALSRIGRSDVPVYDGSWTEWGGKEDTPVVKAE